MNPMMKAVNSLFNHFGTRGIYEGLEVLFILSETDEIVGVGFAKAHTSTITMRVRVSDAPHLSIGEEIVTDDKTYKVMSNPSKESHRLIWSLEVVCS